MMGGMPSRNCQGGRVDWARWIRRQKQCVSPGKTPGSSHAAGHAAAPPSTRDISTASAPTHRRTCFGSKQSARAALSRSLIWRSCAPAGGREGPGMRE
jgi:hypothetical protein